MKKRIILDTLVRHFGGKWEIQRTDTTNFSTIYYLSNGTLEMVAKDIVPHLFEVTPEKKRTALVERLNGDTHRFRELLVKHDVPLSTRFMTIHPSDYSGAIQILSYEGVNCLEILSEDHSPENARKVIRGILEAIKGVLHQNTPPRVGTDLQLANFAVNGGIRYIDCFPPLFYDGRRKIYIVHEPQPTDPDEIKKHVVRKFYTPGTLRRFRFFVLSITKSLEPTLMKEIKRVLAPDLWNDVNAFFKDLPDQRCKGGICAKDLLQLLENVPSSDIDTLRDIGARVIPDGPDRPELLKKLFMYTRTPGPGDDPSKDMTKELFKLLSPFTTKSKSAPVASKT